MVEEQRRARVILAPHLDDAVLSCWAAICDESAAVTVATLFAGIPPRSLTGEWDKSAGQFDSALQVERRRVEDRAALSRCSAAHIHHDFLDEQYRTESLALAALEEAIERLVEGCDEVWIPAGVGGHTDHLLVARAGLRAVRHQRRVLYADLPYSARDRDRVRAWHENADLGFDVRAELLALSPFIPARVCPEVRTLDGDRWMAKLDAVRCYASQLPALCREFGPLLDEPHLLDTELFWDMGTAQPPRTPITSLVGRLNGRVLDEPAGDPFLSVLMRTQGRRNDQLAEALASLAVQTDADFEVVLLPHDLGAEDIASLERLVKSQPAPLPAKTRIVPVTGGGRSRPLNVGLDAAQGRYVAILDDDDLALPTWVQTFSRLASAHPGHVLRAGVRAIRRTNDAWILDGEYPADFDLVDHLVGNNTPVCAMAFPRASLTDLGLRFDEWLPVLEDWQMLLDAAPLCGVASTSDVTSIYRRWGHGDDSQAQHSEAEFAVAGRAVIEAADEKPLVLPPGSVSALRAERITAKAQLEQIAQLHREFETERTTTELRHRSELADSRRASELVAQTLRDELTELRSSRSWRITEPYRRLGSMWLAVRTLTRARSRAGSPTPAPDAGGSEAPGGRLSQTWQPAYFENLYAQDPDPWSFATSWYESRKYQQTVAALPRAHYRRAYEPGCSIGVLTEMLAARCDELVASDFVPAAVESAKARTKDLANVSVEVLACPREWPAGSFDLIVISELATYLSDNDLSLLQQRIGGSLEPEGVLLLVHHRPHGETPQSGDGVHARFRDDPAFEVLATHLEAEFVLDVLQRRNFGATG